jgi:CheY-like chemotaxis protein
VRLKPGQRVFRVLVVDDKDENRVALTSTLAAVGFGVREASDGREAFERWREWRPDLIFMDLVMPVVDGFEATRMIREAESAGPRCTSDDAAGATMPTAEAVSHGPPRRTAIIALSASVFESEQQEVFEAGCDGFIAKPFREAVIFEQIATCLGAEYLFEADDPPTEEQAIDREEARERIARLPPFILSGLRKAVTLGDLEAAGDLVDAVAPVDARLAAELRRLVRGYHLDRLFDLVEGL